MCKLTSIDKLLLLNLKKSEINIRCDDELIGKNSVTPCIKDRIKISITVQK